MVIERYSNPAGVAVPEGNQDMIAFMDNLYAMQGDQVMALEPGEYDITPTIWKNPTYNYNLLVLENGTGALRIMPRHVDSIRVRQGLFQNKVEEGGQTVKLPEDNLYVPIMGPSSNDPSLRIFEIVRYRPDEHGDFRPAAAEFELDDEDELIKKPVRMLREAEDKIIKDAKRRVLQLPWKKYGLSERQAGELFDMGYGLILRQAVAGIGATLPLNILDSESPSEKEILDRVRSRNKRVLNQQYWLVQLEEISPQQATFIRDWLWTKAPEFIAMYSQIDYKQMGLELMDDLRKPLMRLLRDLS